MPPRPSGRGRGAGRGVRRQPSEAPGVKTIKKLLATIDGTSSEKDVAKLISALTEATKSSDEPVVVAACQAISRVCETLQGFLHFFRGHGIDELLMTAQHTRSDAVEAQTVIWQALDSAYTQGVNYLDSIDEVDFFELPHVMFMAFRLAPMHEEIALAVLGAIHRFAVYKLENAAAMLEADILQSVHQILVVHRTPELCHESFEVMYHLCDLPGDLWVKSVLEEETLIQTVVETMEMATMNMRLQVAGLRLVTLWARADNERIKKLTAQAEAVKAAQRTIKDLEAAGLADQAAWVATITNSLVNDPAIAAAARRQATASSFAGGEDSPGGGEDGDEDDDDEA